MELFTLFLLAVGLSFDSFAVSLSAGIVEPGVRFQKAMKFAFALAVFQGLMPLIGWLAGNSIQEYIQPVDHWIAFVLLAAIGLNMIRQSRKRGNGESELTDPFKPAVLVGIAIATSIDALVAGVGIALAGTAENHRWPDALLMILIIGGVTFIASMIGLFFGKKAGSHLGSRMEMIGGLLLIAIGIKILLEHLWVA